MTDKQDDYVDPLLDEVRQRRAELVRKHGGLCGWVEHVRRVQEESQMEVISFRPKTLRVPKR